MIFNLPFWFGFKFGMIVLKLVYALSISNDHVLMGPLPWNDVILLKFLVFENFGSFNLPQPALKIRIL